MTKTRSALPVILLASGACLFALAACAPNAMPRGYAYHDEVYKSPNPPESAKFTREQRKEMGPEQADQFRLAVYELVDKLTLRAGIPPKPVFVQKPEPMTVFHANIDNDLRESLRHVGYQLADTSAGAYVFSYSVEVLKGPDGKKLPDDPSKPNVRIGLYVSDKIGDDSRVLTQEIGDYYIKGADVMNVPFASFPGTLIPEPTGPAKNIRE